MVQDLQVPQHMANLVGPTNNQVTASQLHTLQHHQRTQQLVLVPMVVVLLELVLEPTRQQALLKVHINQLLVQTYMELELQLHRNLDIKVVINQVTKLLEIHHPVVPLLVIVRRIVVKEGTSNHHTSPIHLVINHPMVDSQEVQTDVEVVVGMVEVINPPQVVTEATVVAVMVVTEVEVEMIVMVEVVGGMVVAMEIKEDMAGMYCYFVIFYFKCLCIISSPLYMQVALPGI